MQWPFADWGADVVMSGHDHDYERLHAHGIPYFVNGLGGSSKRGMGYWESPASQFFYGDDFGAMLVTAVSHTIHYQFFSIANDGTLIDELIDFNDNTQCNR